MTQILLACFAAPFLAGGMFVLGFIVLLWGLVVVDKVVDLDGGAELPAWGRPIGAEELQNYPSCSGNNPDRNPCRTMEFGTNRSFDEVLTELNGSFEAHGWSTAITPWRNNPSLNAAADGGEKCIWFNRQDQFPPRAEESDYMQKRRTYAVIIGVSINECWGG